MRPTATELTSALGLEPHPEGGFFLETYRAAQTVVTPSGERPVSTAILFLITSGSISRLHRLAGDELWVFQGGLALELVTLDQDGTLGAMVLGGLGDVTPSSDEDLRTSQSPSEAAGGRGANALQALVPAGSWQGARVAGGPHLPAERAWSLVSCVVSPGFHFDDFELGRAADLLAAYPQHEALIREFT